MNKEKQFLRTILYCINLAWSTSPFYTVCRFFSFFVTALIPYITIYASKALIDILTNYSALAEPYAQAIILLAVITLVTLITAMNSKLMVYLQVVHNEMVSNTINLELMHKTLSMDMEFYDSADYLNALQAVMIDSSSLSNIIWNILNGVSYLISLIVAFVMISSYQWVFAVVLVLSAIPSAVMNNRYSRLLHGWFLDHLSEERKMQYIRSVTSDKQYAADIRLFNMGEYLVNRYRSIWQLCFVGRKQMQRRQLIATVIANILPEAFTFVFMVTVIRGIIFGVNTVGDFTLYIGLFGSLTTSLYTVVDALAEIYRDKLKVDTVEKFNARERKIRDNGTLELTGPIEIVFNHVSFRYPQTEALVLEDVSFTIEAGEKVCLIGVNGAGKSTIVKLLLRFYDVTSGEITINGNNIESYTISSLRRAFSTFFQEYANYALTVRENVAISDLDRVSSDEQLIDALSLAGAEELLEKLPAGLDTYLYRVFEEEGYQGSGGEMQKIALARAIHRACDVIIFDEPSSSLDPQAEARFFETIDTFWEDKTALFTSHRLSAVHIADRIMLIDGGTIIEQGTHSQLMELGGKYAELYTLQASKYI